MNEPIIPKERVFKELTLKLMESSTPIFLDGELREVRMQTFTDEQERAEYMDFTLIYDPTCETNNHYEIRVLEANTEDIRVKNFLFYTIHNSYYGILHGTTTKRTKWYIFIVKI